jgi:energy-coupling factor transporter ATP-binding protein EcfA2
MSRICFILGDSGSGKSTSLRHLKAEDVSVMSVTGKELPFKTDIKVNIQANYETVLKWVKEQTKPIMVLDDANYLMSNFEFSTINESGYGKFARNALGMVQVFKAIIDKDSDQTFYIMAHTEQSEDGHLHFKTTGKMVSEKYNPAGITNIVLEAAYEDQADQFVFRVKADGRGVKSPMGMFTTTTVPNDLKVVNETIKAFYAPTKEIK